MEKSAEQLRTTKDTDITKKPTDTEIIKKPTSGNTTGGTMENPEQSSF
jgi:hypothetical protein